MRVFCMSEKVKRLLCRMETAVREAALCGLGPLEME